MVTGFDVAGDGQIAFAASAPEYPSDLFLKEDDRERHVTHLNDEWLAGKFIAPIREVSYKAPDGTPIQGWVMFPPRFTPRRKWPLAVEIHGGPQAMWGPDSPSMWHEWQCLASRGYVVFFATRAARMVMAQPLPAAITPPGASRTRMTFFPALTRWSSAGTLTLVASASQAGRMAGS